LAYLRDLDSLFFDVVQCVFGGEKMLDADSTHSISMSVIKRSFPDLVSDAAFSTPAGTARTSTL
jgi:hypothetical protein